MKKLLTTLFALSAISVAVAKEVNVKFLGTMFTVVLCRGLTVRT